MGNRLDFPIIFPRHFFPAYLFHAVENHRPNKLQQRNGRPLDRIHHFASGLGGKPSEWSRKHWNPRLKHKFDISAHFSGTKIAKKPQNFHSRFHVFSLKIFSDVRIFLSFFRPKSKFSHHFFPVIFTSRHFCQYCKCRGYRGGGSAQEHLPETICCPPEFLLPAL